MECEGEGVGRQEPAAVREEKEEGDVDGLYGWWSGHRSAGVLICTS